MTKENVAPMSPASDGQPEGRFLVFVQDFADSSTPPWTEIVEARTAAEARNLVEADLRADGFLGEFRVLTVYPVRPIPRGQVVEYLEAKLLSSNYSQL